MITYNETYDKRYEKVMEVIAAKNKRVVTAYMAQSTPATYTEGVDIASYIDDPRRGTKIFLDFVDKLNAIAPVDCINAPYPLYSQVALALAWWSKILLPGRELPRDSVWQVEEKMNMQESDYDLILEKGADAFTQPLFAKLFKKEEFDDFMNISMDEWLQQVYVDAGYPVLRAPIIFCPPFETLCGGRGMSHFFMDCYKIPDKVKAVQDVLMEGLRAQANSLKPSKAIMSAWVGGWRGASSMVNRKIWDKLIWPYTLELAKILSANGITPIMHIDSCWDRDIERFAEIPGQFMINPDGMTDVRRARKLLGKRCVVMGDVPVQMLAVSTKEEVKDYCRRLIDDLGVEGLILSPGCDAPCNAKFENLSAINEVAQEF